jgi:hypothetical protein
MSYVVQERPLGRYVIVSPGHEPLPALFESREEAQIIAIKLDMRAARRVVPKDTLPGREVLITGSAA